MPSSDGLASRLTCLTTSSAASIWAEAGASAAGLALLVAVAMSGTSFVRIGSERERAMDGRANTTVGNSTIPDQRRAVLICRGSVVREMATWLGAAGALRAPKRLSKAFTMRRSWPVAFRPSIGCRPRVPVDEEDASKSSKQKAPAAHLHILRAQWRAMAQMAHT